MSSEQANVSPLAGSWVGTYNYPDGSSFEFTLEIPPFTVGEKFKGSGIESGASFTVEGTGVAIGSTGKYGVSWIQTYDTKWQSTAWFWDGVLNKSGDKIDGNWHDPVDDERKRTAPFNLKRVK